MGFPPACYDPVENRASIRSRSRRCHGRDALRIRGCLCRRGGRHQLPWRRCSSRNTRRTVPVRRVQPPAERPALLQPAGQRGPRPPGKPQPGLLQPFLPPCVPLPPERRPFRRQACLPLPWPRPSERQPCVLQTFAAPALAFASRASTTLRDSATDSHTSCPSVPSVQMKASPLYIWDSSTIEQVVKFAGRTKLP
jgi:hypothetical protein